MCVAGALLTAPFCPRSRLPITLVIRITMIILVEVVVVVVIKIRIIKKIVIVTVIVTVVVIIRIMCAHLSVRMPTKRKCGLHGHTSEIWTLDDTQGVSG